MTARDDAVAALDAAIEGARVEGAQSRDAEVQDLTRQVAVLTTRVGELETEVDVLQAYKDSHPEDEEPPPPVDPPVVMGMNFAPTAQPSYEAKAHVARIFVGAGRTDIRQEGEYLRAYAAGVRVFCFSWKDTTTPAWFGTVPDDVTWYGVHWHEPENDIPGTITLAQWKARQVTQMAAVRAAGGIPWVILMGYTMAPAAKRNPADYALPAGTVDGYGIDFYPDKSPNRTQAQIIGAFKAMLPTWGVTRWSVCEYGVIGTASDAVADVKEVKPLIADAEFAAYWSAQATGKPNYRFTTATADAWYSA